MTDSWFEPQLGAFARGGRLLELGCGAGEDSAALTARGFELVASDFLEPQLSQARALVGTRALLRVDHSRPLPFVDGAFDGALASLSLHYFPWDTTVGAFAELRRVLRGGAPLLFRVNATDDVEYGAHDGVELEPNLRAYDSTAPYGRLKRFFDEESVHAALGRGFAIETLRHLEITRWRRPKQVWECLARAS